VRRAASSSPAGGISATDLPRPARPPVDSRRPSNPCPQLYMTHAALRARIRRLDMLVRGLMLEHANRREEPGPLHYVELRAYLDGLAAAADGLERARKALVQADQRIRRV